MTASATVLSSKLVATPNFFPLTPFKDTNDVKYARIAIEMRADTGGCNLEGAYQVANDADVPGAVYTLGAAGYLSAEGIQYPAGFSDISANTDGKQLVRFGVNVKPDANGGIEGCLASIKVDTRGQ